MENDLVKGTIDGQATRMEGSQETEVTVHSEEEDGRILILDEEDNILGIATAPFPQIKIIKFVGKKLNILGSSHSDNIDVVLMEETTFDEIMILTLTITFWFFLASPFIIYMGRYIATKWYGTFTRY